MHSLGNDNMILNLRLSVKFKLSSPLRIVIAYDIAELRSISLLRTPQFAN